MTMANSTVAENFAARKINKSYGRIEWYGSNFHADGDTLLSWYDWPVAYYLGEADGQHVFLKNGDYYSHSTGQHQAAAQSVCAGPTIPFEALRLAGFPSGNVKLENIIAWQEAQQIPIWHEKDDDQWYCGYGGYPYGMKEKKPFSRPLQGMLTNVREYDDFVEAYWHILGGAVLEFEDAAGDPHWFICAMDEWRYFVSELPSRPTSVEHAIELLKPEAVASAEAEGRSIQRQGEWFFVAYPEHSDADIATIMEYDNVTHLRKNLRQRHLPDDSSGNSHDVRYVQDPECIFAKGNVYHRGRDGLATGEHRTVHLGNAWHKVYRNTAIRSWSMGGRVD